MNWLGFLEHPVNGDVLPYVIGSYILLHVISICESMLYCSCAIKRLVFSAHTEGMHKLNHSYKGPTDLVATFKSK